MTDPFSTFASPTVATFFDARSHSGCVPLGSWTKGSTERSVTMPMLFVKVSPPALCDSMQHVRPGSYFIILLCLLLLPQQRIPDSGFVKVFTQKVVHRAVRKFSTNIR